MPRLTASHFFQLKSLKKRKSTSPGRRFFCRIIGQGATIGPAGRLLSNERQQCHEPSSLDGCGNCMLAGSGTTAFPTTHDPSLTIDHFLQEFDVFVIDVHGPRTPTIDENRSSCVERTRERFGHGYACSLVLGAWLSQIQRRTV